ncbi:MAG: sigma-70 family RNA polymerase sigma factor [Rhodothermaceae bacterium]|nr:sigma-70 family RNA polymerase sigma factor [Rhodothermaceae bacterium]
MIPEPAHSKLTILLEDARGGDERARRKAYDAVYEYLLQIARTQRRKRGGNELLKSTELVHEAYIKLERLQKDGWQNRGHFFAVAATAMRQIILNQARFKVAAKRGGNQQQVELEEHLLVENGAAEELISLHEALQKLEKLKPRMAQVVECRFFGGLTVEQTAEALGISTPTVKRDHKEALTWLYKEIGASE